MHCNPLHLQNALTLQILKCSEPSSNASGKPGNVAREDSFVPDHFPCPGSCSDRRHKESSGLSFPPIQGRNYSEITGLESDISCKATFCSQGQEQLGESCFL